MYSAFCLARLPDLMQLFISQLGKALQQPLPGWSAQYALAHESRNSHPAITQSARLAAVMALFFPRQSDWHVALIQRTTHEKDQHSGQISFPGGRHETSDPDLRYTALRETEEEIGLKAQNINILGDLSPLYIPVSNFLVHPCVGYIDYTPSFQPDPREVASVLELPFSQFLSKDAIHHTNLLLPGNRLLENVPHFNINEQVIWGATAMMMSELVSVVRTQQHSS